MDELSQADLSRMDELDYIYELEKKVRRLENKVKKEQVDVGDDEMAQMSQRGGT